MVTNSVSQESVSGEFAADIRQRPASLETELEGYSQANYKIFGIPSDKTLKETYEDSFRDRVAVQIDEFKSLTCIPEETKQRILPQIKRSIAQVQAYQAWYDVQDIIDDIYLNRWLITSIALSIGTLLGFHIIYPSAPWWIALVIGLLLLSLFFFLVLLPYLMTEDNEKANKIVAYRWSIFFIALISTSLVSSSWIQIRFTNEGKLAQLVSQLAINEDILTEVSLYTVFFTFIAFYLRFMDYMDKLPLVLSRLTPTSTFQDFRISGWSRSSLTKSELFTFAFATFSFILSFIFYTSPDSWMHPRLKEIVFVSLTTGTIMQFLAILAILPSKVFTFFMEQLKIRRHPEDEITQTLCYALIYLEDCFVWRNPHDTRKPEEKWKDSRFRAGFVSNLYWIENLIQKRLYTRFSVDPSVKEWLRITTEEMSADFARMAQEVLLPKQDTRDRLIKRLAGDVINAADRNWGKFKRVKAQFILSGWKKIIVSLRNLVVLLIPFIFIIGVLRLDIDTPIKVTIISSAFGLGLASLVSLISPDRDRKNKGSQ